ncbi:hypothetical protein PM082_004588 [Marasmius tenuissimus]|nr:hypothetical protein PM082_004588 [Marasmius tenuissimus]
MARQHFVFGPGSNVLIVSQKNSGISDKKSIWTRRTPRQLTGLTLPLRSCIRATLDLPLRPRRPPTLSRLLTEIKRDYRLLEIQFQAVNRLEPLISCSPRRFGPYFTANTPVRWDAQLQRHSHRVQDVLDGAPRAIGFARIACRRGRRLHRTVCSSWDSRVSGNFGDSSTKAITRVPCLLALPQSGKKHRGPFFEAPGHLAHAVVCIVSPVLDIIMPFLRLVSIIRKVVAKGRVVYDSVQGTSSQRNSVFR